MTAPDERLAYLRSIIASRGYAHRSHRLLATHDLPVLRALDRIPLANYVASRRLDDAAKEAVLIAAFACVRAPPYIVAAHIRKAVALGATPAQALECIRLVQPDAGAVACAGALEAWSDLHAARGPTEEITAMQQPEPATRRASPEVAAAVDGLRQVLEGDARSLDARTRGLVGVVALACLRAPRPMLETRLREALAAGATPKDLLEALELIITPAGLPCFDAALTVWAEVTGAEELDATREDT